MYLAAYIGIYGRITGALALKVIERGGCGIGRKVHKAVI